MVTTDPGKESAPRARVLVADDDALTRELVAAKLREHRYEVETVEDGQAAIERFEDDKFDVVLLDVVMPRVSGIEACRTIKGSRGGGERETDIPVLLSFAKTDVKSRIEALRSGTDGYVCKPFEEVDLLAAIASALRIKRLRDQLRAAQKEVERLRSQDELTGACSFVELHHLLAKEFARAEEHAEPLACCIVDVDGLRIHNEQGGRALGDEILRGVSEVIVSSLRESDIVARYGDDSFFVMLPSTHFAGSLVVASRIWRDVASRAFGNLEAHVTLSVGVALFPSRDVRTKDALLEALEAALLEAKRKGGNRLCVFQQEGFIYTPVTDDG